MRPERKQKMLDEACAASPQVSEAYDTLQILTDLHADKDQHSDEALAADKEIEDARRELQTALKKHGMNAFNARDLSHFVARGNENVTKGFNR